MSVDCRPSDVGLLAVTANNIITINKVGVCEIIIILSDLHL